MDNAKKKEKRRYVLIGLAVIVAIALTGFVLIKVNVKDTSSEYTTTYMKIGDRKVSRLEYDFYYTSIYKDFVSTYSSYLSSMGLDTSSDLSEQNYNNLMTWDEYFQKQAAETIQRNDILYDQGQENNFEYDTDEALEKAMDGMQTLATSNEMELSEYITTYYGDGATEDNITDILTRQLYAEAYMSELKDGYALDDDAIESYYKKHKKSFDYVDYYIAGCASEELAEKAEAAATSKSALLSYLQSQESSITESNITKTKISYSACDTDLRDWLFSSKRKKGDTTIIQDSATGTYYTLLFNKRYRDTTKTASVRHILIAPSDTDSDDDWNEAKEKAGSILKEYEDGDQTEDSFAALATKYSEDPGSVNNGGLYEDFSEGTMVDTFNDWSFDTSRKAGDTGIVKTSYGYHIMYFVSKGHEVWYNSVQSAAETASFNDWLEPFTEEDTYAITGDELTYEDEEDA